MMADDDVTPWQPPLDDKTDIAQRMTRNERQPLQFSLRTVFIITMAWSIASAGLFAGPAWAVLLTTYCLVLAVPIVLTVVAIYGGPYRRTFCIGAMFPAGSILLEGSRTGAALVSYRYGGMAAYLSFEDRLVVGIAVGVALVVIIACGLLAVGVRRMVEAAQNSQPGRAEERDERGT